MVLWLRPCGFVVSFVQFMRAHSDDEILEAMQMRSFDYYQTDARGNTVIHVGVRKGTDLLHKLLSKVSDMFIVRENESKRNALSIAAQYKRWKNTRAILQRLGGRAAKQALMQGGKHSAIEYLAKHRADKNARQIAKDFRAETYFDKIVQRTKSSFSTL